MDNDIASIKHAFKQQFEDSGFISGEVVDLKDTKVGFSFYKDRKDLGENRSSLFRFFLLDKELLDPSPQKSLQISVSYGIRSDEDGLVVSSTHWSPTIYDPVSLRSSGDYFYDISTNRIVSKKGKETPVIDLLNTIEGLHLKPTRTYRGLPFRFKYSFFTVLIPGVLRFFYQVLRYTLLYVFGVKVAKAIWSLDEDELRQSVDKVGKFDIAGFKADPENVKQITILNYPVPIGIAFIYSAVHLYIYFRLFFNTQSMVFESVSSNLLLATFYVVVSLTFFIWFMNLLERVIFYLIKQVLNFPLWIIWIKKKHIEYSFKRIRV